MLLRKIELCDVEAVMEIINTAKRHLKEQGIDQWQKGYPDKACICEDAMNQTGYFIMEEELILGYLCIDYAGEPAYEALKGTWDSEKPYVVVHRMAFTEHARGKHLSSQVFRLVEEMSVAKGVYSFRIDTDEENKKMQHILKKNGFTYRGIVWIDNSEKIAFDKNF